MKWGGGPWRGTEEEVWEDGGRSASDNWDQVNEHPQQ